MQKRFKAAHARKARQTQQALTKAWKVANNSQTPKWDDYGKITYIPRAEKLRVRNSNKRTKTWQGKVITTVTLKKYSTTRQQMSTILKF